MCGSAGYKRKFRQHLKAAQGNHNISQNQREKTALQQPSQPPFRGTYRFYDTFTCHFISYTFKQPPQFLARIQQDAANTPGRFWCFTASQHLNTQPLAPWQPLTSWLCIHSQRCVSHCESINPNFWSQTMKGSGSQRKNLEVRLHRLFPTLATNSWHYPLVWGHPLCTGSAAHNNCPLAGFHKLANHRNADF